ncbi:hypothetical protein ASG17_04750 [Brevundimonas sp. Leaf363]|nr:hypothetical protein ASG17_04750 [Brevundimonas sp. Leaf363]
MDAPKPTIDRARDLRRKLTLPEVVLWTAIRGSKVGGARFRRQHPVGPYILDFYCDALKLALEVDGEGHERPDQARADIARDAWLGARGIEVWRIPARDVLQDLAEVVERIERRVRREPPPPLRGPPPPMGEDL